MQNTCYKNLAALREKKKTHTRIHEVLSDGKNKRHMAMGVKSESPSKEIRLPEIIAL
jgi:hypothetical protein